MDLKDKKRKYKYTDTFKFALSGIRVSFIKEKNLKFHFIFGLFVIVLGVIFNLTPTEWMFVLIAVLGMMVVEMINTSIERVVDLVTEQYHPLAKQAKDIAAGAVLIYAILSVLIGIIIFFPKILVLIQR
jgi:undecaprenol kinase